MNEPHQVPIPFLQEEPNRSLLLLLCGHPHLFSILNDLLSHHGGPTLDHVLLLLMTLQDPCLKGAGYRIKIYLESRKCCILQVHV